MENVHNAIAWYQKKIGSYDKQLWEQSVEKKLQKQPPFVLHNAPRKKVRLKTEYIDVDLIRGSTFAKAKPQVPWVYITRKAVARVLFFPFYYNWWVHQTSKQLYAVLLVLYLLQVVTIIVYLRNFDHSIMEDELSFTEVILPAILMFLLCLIHSQTVLAHINHKPPKRAKSISGVVRAAHSRKVSRKSRASGNNSTGAEDGANTDTSKPPKIPASTGITTSELRHQSQDTTPPKNQDAVPPATLDMEKNLMSRSVSDYELKTMTSSMQSDSAHHAHRHQLNCLSAQDLRQRKHTNSQVATTTDTFQQVNFPPQQSSQPRPERQPNLQHESYGGAWGPNIIESSQAAAGKAEFSYLLLNNSAHLLTVEKVSRSDMALASDNDDTEDGDNDVGIKAKKQEGLKCLYAKAGPPSSEEDNACDTDKLVPPAASACHDCVDSVRHSDEERYTDFTGITKTLCSCAALRFCADKTLSSLEEKDSYACNLKPNLMLKTVNAKTTLHDPFNSFCCSTIKPLDVDELLCCGRTDHENKGVPSKCSVSTSTSGIADIHDLSQTAHISSNCGQESCPEPAALKGCIPNFDKVLKNYHVKFSSPTTQEPNVSHSWPEVSPHRQTDSGHNCHLHSKPPMSDAEAQLHHFSEAFVNDILKEETLGEMSCNSLLAHSDLENSSSSFSHFSNSSSSISSLSSSYRVSNIPTSQLISQKGGSTTALCSELPEDFSQPTISLDAGIKKAGELTPGDPLDESMEQINLSDGERPSDVSNYNPSDSDGESDVPVNEEILTKLELKWKKLRFQEEDVVRAGFQNVMTQTNPSLPAPSGVNTPKLGAQGVSRSVVGILTRKPSPLKDLALGRGTNTNAANSSGSDVANESRNQLRRRRRASGTIGESGEGARVRNVPSTLGLRPHAESTGKHLSSSENETGGHTPEGSNKATMSSEEWEDRMQSDETTSSNYSSSCCNTDDSGEEGEEKTEYTTSTLHVINLLQPGLQPGCHSHLVQTSNGLLTPGIMTNQGFTFCKPKQSGSPTSSGTITQPDKVACVIWEGNECKKVDLTALDIGWAIIDKVDSLPESSDYFLIGLLLSVIIGLVPLVFRVYVNKEMTKWEDLITWTGIQAHLSEVPSLIFNTYSWRQYLLMINGMLQRFFLSLIFFFLLSVADRTFKQRLLYAKHFSYLTSSRRARKFAMPHFRLNKVRNIKIWLSLRSYLKRRGPQRSVDVIVSASFMCAICTVCLISLQMLKDTEGYLDYLCNWELLVWCISFGVFLMRFMTVGLKINKKYRNLSVLITEQINLYLQMEQKPHKKEELILANNVLRLAEDLLKELESPFKISGFSANPLIYNILKVVVLSAFSAVLTEVLGFKLKLHKIKLKG